MKFKQFRNGVHRLDFQPMLSPKRIKSLWKKGFTVSMLRSLLIEHKEKLKLKEEEKKDGV